MTTTHHLHFRTHHIDIGHRPLQILGAAATIAIAATTIVAINSTVSSDGSASVELDTARVVTNPLESGEPINMLLDGVAFDAALIDAVASVESPSALLDGVAFAEAVEQAVAGTSGLSDDG